MIDYRNKVIKQSSISACVVIYIVLKKLSISGIGALCLEPTCPDSSVTIVLILREGGLSCQRGGESGFLRENSLYFSR